jgi:hypothetical protein
MLGIKVLLSGKYKLVFYQSASTCNESAVLCTFRRMLQSPNVQIWYRTVKLRRQIATLFLNDKNESAKLCYSTRHAVRCNLIVLSRGILGVMFARLHFHEHACDVAKGLFDLVFQSIHGFLDVIEAGAIVEIQA